MRFQGKEGRRRTPPRGRAEGRSPSRQRTSRRTPFRPGQPGGSCLWKNSVSQQDLRAVQEFPHPWILSRI